MSYKEQTERLFTENAFDLFLDRVGQFLHDKNNRIACEYVKFSIAQTKYRINLSMTNISKYTSVCLDHSNTGTHNLKHVNQSFR